MQIAIEGMDGVGKTTCAKQLAMFLGYPCISHPTQYFFQDGVNNPEFQKSLGVLYKMDDPLIKAWFMGLGNLYAARHQKNAVFDRHFASNFFWNETEETKVVFKTLIDIIGKPDLTILLYASNNTRRERLKKRDMNDKDLKDDEKWTEGYGKMERFLQEFQLPYKRILTDGKNEKEVLKEVLSHVNNISIQKACPSIQQSRLLSGRGAHE